MMNWGSFQTKIINACFIVTVVSCLGFSEGPLRWQRIWNGVQAAHVKKIYVDKRNNGTFWVLGDHALYRIDKDNHPHLSLSKSVSDLIQNPSSPNEMFAITEDGVEHINEDGSWTNVLLRRDCRAITIAQNRLVVATDEGLFIRKSEDQKWDSMRGQLFHQPFVLLASYGQVVYAATPTALYRYDSATDSYKEIFSSGVSREQQSEEMPLEQDHVPLFQEIRDIDVSDLGEIYVSTHRGIFHTQNDGIQWQALPTTGLSLPIAELSVDADHRTIWAATREGVFGVQGERWNKTYRGLPTNDIHGLAVDSEGNVYISTNRGFFAYSLGKAVGKVADIKSFTKMFGQYEDVEQYFSQEPTVQEVQAMAIEYADVHPDKIKRWQKQSRLKALVPSLSTGIDRSATDLMHWDTGSSPDVLSKGRDFLEWDVGLSWDFADMVWSSDQTSIDSRSKLMVELREEILDQVTRVYFERRRLQLVLLSDDHESDLIEEEMRLSELSATLDAYTGGQFSKKTRKSSRL